MSEEFDIAITNAAVHAAAFALRFAAEKHRTKARGLMSMTDGFKKRLLPVDTPESLAEREKARGLQKIADNLLSGAGAAPEVRITGKNDLTPDLERAIGSILARENAPPRDVPASRVCAREETPDATAMKRFVPVEPTPEMIAAGAEACRNTVVRGLGDVVLPIWLAMVAAAPDHIFAGSAE